jgi:hypothetical protein
VAHTVNQATTTVTITGDALGTATVVGESYTVSGRVTPVNTTGTHTNTGTVEVSDATDTCTDTTLSWNVSGYWEWSCNLISTTEGSKTLTATYSGDSNYSGNSGTDSHTVNQATTTVAITGEALETATVVGETYTVSGRVTPAYTTGIHTNSGTVTVSDGTSADDVTGIPLTWSVDHWEWSTSFTSNTAGTSKTITATYSGDSNYNGDDDTASHTVNQASTATTVTSSVNPSVTGQSVTFTATVASVSPGTGIPAGTVTFYKGSVGGTLIGSDSLDGSGEATVMTTFNASEDPVAIFAVYDEDEATTDDDPDYSTSTSAEYTQRVNKPNTTTTITGTDLGTATDVGVSYTVNGTLTVALPGAAMPSGSPTTTGTVTVSDGTDAVTIPSTDLTWDTDHWNWSTDSLCGGSPPCFTSTTAGVKTLTVTYSGDGSYNGSSASTTHTVDQGTVSIGITQDPDPWTAGPSGTSGTFTATVTAATGFGTPSGTVTFQIKDKNYVTIADSGPHTLSSGSAESNLVTLYAYQSMVHVTATYSGDANFSTNSGTANVTVYPLGFTITGDDPDPSLTTEAYTVTWAFASGVDPSGKTVDIDDGDTIQTVNATNYSVTMPARGSASETRTITAIYSDGPTTVTEQHDVLVLVRDTDTAVSGPSAPTCVSQPVLLTATVTDETAPPDGPGFTGTITWTTNNGSGTFDPVTCNISQGGQCSTYYTPVASDVGTVNITASYSGDDAYGSSVSSPARRRRYRHVPRDGERHVVLCTHRSNRRGIGHCQPVGCGNLDRGIAHAYCV